MRRRPPPESMTVMAAREDAVTTPLDFVTSRRSFATSAGDGRPCRPAARTGRPRPAAAVLECVAAGRRASFVAIVRIVTANSTLTP